MIVLVSFLVRASIMLSTSARKKTAAWWCHSDDLKGNTMTESACRVYRGAQQRLFAWWLFSVVFSIGIVFPMISMAPERADWVVALEGMLKNHWILQLFAAVFCLTHVVCAFALPVFILLIGALLPPR